MTEIEKSEEELISEGEPIRGIPLWVRLVIGLLAAIVIVAAVVLMWRYACEPTKYASPKELQLSNLLIFWVVCLVCTSCSMGKAGDKNTEDWFCRV